ncbi:hypothetical protein B0H14DRAFT_3596073 [Mycena olivaceomarginata]|nr:hypothetical protein B0H14DRAFT_3596073 [Mycena olivaceomarginata]
MAGVEEHHQEAALTSRTVGIPIPDSVQLVQNYVELYPNWDWGARARAGGEVWHEVMPLCAHQHQHEPFVGPPTLKHGPDPDFGAHLLSSAAAPLTLVVLVAMPVPVPTPLTTQLQEDDGEDDRLPPCTEASGLVIIRTEYLAYGEWMYDITCTSLDLDRELNSTARCVSGWSRFEVLRRLTDTQICDIVSSTRRSGRSIRAFHSDRRTNKSSNVKPVFRPTITTLIITALVGPRRFHSSSRIDRGVQPRIVLLSLADFRSPSPDTLCDVNQIRIYRRHFGPGLASPEAPVAEASHVASGKQGIRTRRD